MRSNNSVEHFVTLFDRNYLAFGYCLLESLKKYARPFHLWILCLDETVENYFSEQPCDCVTVLPLKRVETRELLEVKPGRSPAEYCWTLTPFAPGFVFDRDPSIERVTYVDADLFFFDDPRKLLRELDESGKHVLITEHAYDPKYEQSKTSGRFCVQFLTIRNSVEGRNVLSWWQERCLEWCFARFEDGKFGDQKYLDLWPEMFGVQVHIVNQVDKTLAPWNVNFFEKKGEGILTPVFYHFHGVRIVALDRVSLFHWYKIGPAAMRLYDKYILEFRKGIKIMRENQIPLKIAVPDKRSPEVVWKLLRAVKRKMLNSTREI